MFQKLKARFVAIYMMPLLAFCISISQPALAELLPVPALKAHITDLTQTLSQAERTALEDKLASLN